MIDDATLGGYLDRHDRPPAFEGTDGNAYSAALYVEDAPDANGRFSGAVLFVRWSPAGDAPTGHLETEYLAYGGSREEVETALRALSLHDVKIHLDRLVAARAGLSDW